ncbi:hypothetical protein ACFLU6_06570, partial [Acidobacteriota bacterium]
MKLKKKLSLLAVGGVVFSSLAAVLCAHLSGERIIEQVWKKRFEDFTDTVALPMSPYVVDRDLVLLDAYAYDLKSRESLYIHSIRVIDTEGETLVNLPEQEGSPDQAGNAAEQ